MTRILAIGKYKDFDAQALRDDFAPIMLADPGEISALGEKVREGIEGIALMAHKAFGPEEIALLPNLRALAIYGVGYDAIDIEAVIARGITVTNTPGVLSDDVADTAIGLWIAVARNFEEGAHLVRSADWAHRPPRLGHTITGRRTGIVGLGRIGREIANRLTGFRSEIHYLARSPKDTPGWTFHADILSLAHAVDDLFIATVGGVETRGMVGANVLAALGPGYVINIARGTVIDERALIAALDNGPIRGAGLDVFQGEPNVDPRLARHPKVYPLPHIASATIETRARMGALQRSNLRALLAGDPPLTPVT